MSLFSTTQITCPKCEQETSFEEVGSINADRRPDLRQGILDGTLENNTCSQCNESFVLEPDLNYMDADRGQWIAAYPSYRVLDHLEAADEMTELFEKSFGESAGKAEQELGKSLIGRVVFGWPAMREKLLIRELQLDEVAVELMKIDFLRDGDDIPFDAASELRFVEVDDTSMIFCWFGPAVDDAQRILELEVDRYQDIIANIDDWKAIVEQLTDSPFVDIKKLYLGAGRVAESAETAT